MSQNGQCKMDFYFTRERIEKLLAENPKAKGIIISQEIKVRHTADNKIINVIEIKATADNGKNKSRSTAFQSVHGCPSPPGCDVMQELA